MVVTALVIFGGLVALVLAAAWLLARLLPAIRRRVAPRQVRTVSTAAPKALTPFTGQVHVIDGDTIVVNRTRIRLFGMDAPELSQHGGRRAQSHLILLAGGKLVRVEPVVTDCYGRIVARVWMEEVDLSDRIVRDGFAVATSKWNSDYDSAELEARRYRRGLWADNPDRGISDPAAHRRWKAIEEDRAGVSRAAANVVDLPRSR
jgi:endonuclease YncB( thermonuclease family)